MKYEASNRARNEYAKLSDDDEEKFDALVLELNVTYKRFREEGGTGVPTWPKKLRIKSVQGAAGVFEATWSFSGPDGRATFEYFDAEDGEVGIRWRRIGDHGVFDNP